MANIPGGSQQSGGDTPHGAVDSGNPLKIGARARVNVPASTNDDERTDLIGSANGGGLLIAGEEPGGAVSNISLDASANVRVAGNVDHDGLDARGPIKIGGRARSTNIAAVANDDRTDQVMSLTGGLMVAGDDGTGPVNLQVAASGKLEVIAESGVAHDAPDGENPLKVGGTATAAAPTAVGEGDRVQASFDLQGQLRTIGGSIGNIAGDIAHDAIDSGNPVKTGGRARTSAIVAVANDDRVDQIMSTTGGLLIAAQGIGGAVNNLNVSTGGLLSTEAEAEGDIAHDALDSGNPVKVGGRARTTLFAVVAENDRVDQAMSLTGGALVAAETVSGQVVNLLVENSGQLISTVTGRPDEAHDSPDADSPIKIGGRARATAIAAVATDDRTDAIMSLTGAITIAGTFGAGAPTNIMVGAAGQVNIQGDTGSDSPDAGDPVKVGGRARTTQITNVAQNDRVDAVYSVFGAATIAGVDSVGAPLGVAVGDAGQVRIEGGLDHDDPETENPVPVGLNAAEFNADPPQVSADNDRVRAIATPQGIQWTLGGHPNIINREYHATGAQTNDEIIASVAPGSQIIITRIAVTLDAETTAASVKVRIGFGTTGTVPTEPANGAFVDGMVIAHGGIAPGSGIVEGVGGAAPFIGGDGLELGITCTAPTGGELKVTLSFYISSL